MGRVLIRRASPADMPAVEQVHLAAWRETYDGVIPAEAAVAAVAERSACWRSGTGEAAVFLACREGEAPAGFAACGSTTSSKLLAAGFAGEFHAIYLLRRLHRQGAGRLLMQAMARRLLSAGVESAGLWVLRDSPARRFYEALGARETGIQGVWPVAGLELPDIAYGWCDLRVLAGHQ